MFLKLYETERVHITIAGISDWQLFREKVWPIVEEIAARRKFVYSLWRENTVVSQHDNNLVCCKNHATLEAPYRTKRTVRYVITFDLYFFLMTVPYGTVLARYVTIEYKTIIYY